MSPFQNIQSAPHPLPPQSPLGLRWYQLRVPAAALPELSLRFESAGFPARKVDGALEWQDADGTRLRVVAS